MGSKTGKRNRLRKRHLGHDLVDGLRQATFPAPIRIARSPYEEELDEWIDRFLAEAQAGSEARDAKVSAETPAAKRAGKPGGGVVLEDFFTSQMDLMTRVGTGLWRLRQKFLAPEATGPTNDARRSQRQLESVWEAMADAGFNIMDHTNQPYEPRMALHVVSIEPTAGQVGEVVLETLKPSIYYKDRCIQMGEVIIAVPEHTETPPDAVHTAVS